MGQAWALGVERWMKPVLTSRRHRQVFLDMPHIPTLAPGDDYPAPHPECTPSLCSPLEYDSQVLQPVVETPLASGGSGEEWAPL